MLRLPKDVTDDVQDDPTGVRALYDRGNLNGAPQKIELITQFYVGSMITTLQKTNLVPGAEDALVYTTITGAIGLFVPFVSRDEYELFQTLEMHMRVEFPPLCGRDHLAYRSFYAPIKNVVDGDMCEQFGMVEAVKQREIAENLGRKATEVAKKLEDMRTRYAF
uniref:Cleavage/polyadenylation specificity factor A subunit C-terminal domain-containing protein n=1 Tax=Panagrolaimus davidi TaxID=227884 RepID=A0A914QYY4_9BILA